MHRRGSLAERSAPTRWWILVVPLLGTYDSTLAVKSCPVISEILLPSQAPGTRAHFLCEGWLPQALPSSQARLRIARPPAACSMDFGVGAPAGTLARFVSAPPCGREAWCIAARVHARWTEGASKCLAVRLCPAPHQWPLGVRVCGQQAPLWEPLWQAPGLGSACRGAPFPREATCSTSPAACGWPWPISLGRGFCRAPWPRSACKAGCPLPSAPALCSFLSAAFPLFAFLSAALCSSSSLFPAHFRPPGDESVWHWGGRWLVVRGGPSGSPSKHRRRPLGGRAYRDGGGGRLVRHRPDCCRHVGGGDTERLPVQPADVWVVGDRGKPLPLHEHHLCGRPACPPPPRGARRRPPRFVPRGHDRRLRRVSVFAHGAVALHRRCHAASVGRGHRSTGHPNLFPQRLAAVGSQEPVGRVRCRDRAPVPGLWRGGVHGLCRGRLGAERAVRPHPLRRLWGGWANGRERLLHGPVWWAGGQGAAGRHHGGGDIGGRLGRPRAVCAHTRRGRMRGGSFGAVKRAGSARSRGKRRLRSCVHSLRRAPWWPDYYWEFGDRTAIVAYGVCFVYGASLLRNVAHPSGESKTKKKRAALGERAKAPTGHRLEKRYELATASGSTSEPRKEQKKYPTVPPV